MAEVSQIGGAHDGVDRLVHLEDGAPCRHNTALPRRPEAFPEAGPQDADWPYFHAPGPLVLLIAPFCQGRLWGRIECQFPQRGLRMVKNSSAR